MTRRKIPTSTLFLTLLSLSFVSFVLGKLQVTNLAQLNLVVQDPELKDIPYSIANFGFAPFGKTMVAQLVLSPGFDKQCNNVNSDNITKQIQNSFLLIPRGQCTFVTKALHAQQLGAKMAIIMDNDEHERGIIMKDNGYGYKVNIPAIFINYKSGQKLVSLVNSTNSKVTLKILFENIKTQKAQVSLYMQSFNRLSYYFIQQFQPFYQKIKNHITFKLVYDVINCSKCSSDDCYYNGQYCSVNYDHRNSASGKEVLDQQLRQQIIYEKHNNKWWEYIRCFSEQCEKITQAEQCSNKCLNKNNIQINPSVLKGELAQSFDVSNDNQILRRNQQILKTAGIESYPSVTINGIRIRGSLNAEFVFDDICNTLINPPGDCSKYIIQQERNITSDKMYWFIIILVLVICAALFTALFVVCKRQMRKNMANQMQGRVDDMVSKYIEFYSERNNRR